MYGLEEMRIRQVIMTLNEMKSYIRKNFKKPIDKQKENW